MSVLSCFKYERRLSISTAIWRDIRLSDLPLLSSIEIKLFQLKLYIKTLRSTCTYTSCYMAEVSTAAYEAVSFIQFSFSDMCHEIARKALTVIWVTYKINQSSIIKWSQRWLVQSYIYWYYYTKITRYLNVETVWFRFSIKT